MAASDIVKATKGDQEAEFVRSAFDAVWKDKGWKLVEDDQPVQAAPVADQNAAADRQQAAAKKAATDNR